MVDRVGEFEEKFLTFLDGEKQILSTISQAREMKEETETALKAALEKFKDTHPALFS
jgi:F0F1-type ATP synthase alpha subunit